MQRRYGCVADELKVRDNGGKKKKAPNYNVFIFIQLKAIYFGRLYMSVINNVTSSFLFNRQSRHQQGVHSLDREN